MLLPTIKTHCTNGKKLKIYNIYSNINLYIVNI